MNYFQRNYQIILIGDMNVRLGSIVGDTASNERHNWAITYTNNYKFQIMNAIEPNKGIFTWHRGKSKAILDYVCVPFYATSNYHLQIVPMISFISDHNLLYLTAKTNPIRQLMHPQKMILYPKWKFFIKLLNSKNKHNYDKMLNDIGYNWDQFKHNNNCISHPSVNDITNIFKVAYTIIWQAAYDNNMCTIIPLSHKMYSQQCRDHRYINQSIVQLLDDEIDLIYSQNNLMRQVKYSNNIVNNSILQHKIEIIGIELEKIRKNIRSKRMEAIDECLKSTYDPNDQDKIRRYVLWCQP